MSGDTISCKIEAIVEAVFKENPAVARTELTAALVRLGVTYGWTERLKQDIDKLAGGGTNEPR